MKNKYGDEFKPGDKVLIVTSDIDYIGEVKEMIGKISEVDSLRKDRADCVWVKNLERTDSWSFNIDELRLIKPTTVTAKQIVKELSQKILKLL